MNYFWGSLFISIHLRFHEIFFQTQIPALCPSDLLRPQFSHFRLWIFFNFLWIWFLCLFELLMAQITTIFAIFRQTSPQEIWSQEIWSLRNSVPKKFGSSMKIILQHFMQGPNFSETKFLRDQIWRQRLHQNSDSYFSEYSGISI